MTILVTGAAGFIGSHFVDRLLADGHHVIGVDNLISGTKLNLSLCLDNQAFRFIQMDVRKLESVNNLGPVDVILHLAALGSVPRSMEHPTLYMNNNVMGFHGVLEFARINFVKTVYYASSSSVYGNAQKFYRYEVDPMAPVSPYAGTKAINEVQADFYERTFWIQTHGLRLFNVYGPRQRLDSPYAAMVPRFCESILKRREVVLFGDGNQIRTFTPIEFVVDSVVTMIYDGTFRKAQVNITHQDYAASVIDTAKLIGRLLAVDYKVVKEPPRAGDVKTSIGNGQILEDFLGENLAAAFPTVEAMLNTCQWYRDLIVPK